MLIEMLHAKLTIVNVFIQIRKLLSHVAPIHWLHFLNHPPPIWIQPLDDYDTKFKWQIYKKIFLKTLVGVLGKKKGVPLTLFF